MKAVIYARYSSHSQTEQSIEGQLRDCYAYAKRRNLVIVGEYIDRAITGTVDERPEFQRMLIDAERGGFEAILTWKTDRFARNRYDSIIYKAKLKKQGIKLFYAKEEIPDGPEGIIMESLLEALAEYYVAEMKVKIKRGLRESALKCKYSGGIMALGYSHDAEGNYILDEKTAPLIPLIFSLYAADTPIIEICRQLNDKGYTTAQGGEFNKNSLRRLLVNKKYIGTYSYGDVVVENGIPALVDRELFDIVQNKLKNVKGGGRRQRLKYLLSDKLYCGACGSTMTGYSGTGKSGKLFGYYRCTNRRAGSCEADVIGKDWIEDLVVRETVNRVLAPEIIDLVADRCVEIQLNSSKATAEELALKKQIAEVEKSINNIMAAIEAGIFTATTKNRLAELETQKEKLEYTLALASVRPPIVDKDQIMYMLSRYLDKDYTELKARQDLINSFVDSVIYYPGRVDIYYNILQPVDNSTTPLCSSIALHGGANVPISEHLFITNNLLLLLSLSVYR